MEQTTELETELVTELVTELETELDSVEMGLVRQVGTCGRPLGWQVGTHHQHLRPGFVHLYYLTWVRSGTPVVKPVTIGRNATI